MTKIVIKPRYPEVLHVTPVTLDMPMTKESKESTLSIIDSNFKKLGKWLNVERNYNT